MKKLYFLLFALISGISFGQVIISEDFAYGDGNLVPNGGWANVSGSESLIQVVSGEAVLTHGGGSREDVNISFSAVSGNIYAAFDFSVDDLGAPYSGTDNEYFAHFSVGSGSFTGRIDIVPPSGAGDYSVGIATTGGSADATWATDLTFGTTYRLVMRYDQDGNQAEIWINPSADTDTSILSADLDDPGNSITAFGLRQSNSSPDETIRIDDLMIGQTFNDVLTFVANTDPEITITNPSNGETLAPGTTSVDVIWTTDNLMGGETVNITVNGSTTNDASSPFPVATMDGETYDVTVELVNGGVLDSDMISFSVGSITQVVSITELRAGSIGENYELTGEAIVSYIVTEGTRNQKYIQDAGAGILIDDTAGTLSFALNAGDGITGLKGELSIFAGVLQFVPLENISGTSSTGNTLTPIDVTAGELSTNGEVYESRLIRLLNVTFDPADAGNTFSDNTNYDVTTSGGADMTVCRVSFGDEDLIGTTIPADAVNITGLGSEFNGTKQIFPRFASDIDSSLSIAELGTNSFSIYPNPAKTDVITISSNNSEVFNVAVYNILGKQVKNATVSNNRLDVSQLNSGMYIVKITQNNNSVTKKLIIE